MRRIVLPWVLFFLLACCSPGPETPSEVSTLSSPQTPGMVILNEDLTSYSLFRPENWCNQDIRQAPVSLRSQELIDWIGGARLHPDFGPSPYGIPYVTVSGSQPLVPVTFVEFSSWPIAAPTCSSPERWIGAGITTSSIQLFTASPRMISR